MGTAKIDLERPLYTFTAGELLDLIQTAIQPVKVENTATNQGKRYVYGIGGISELFNCSKTTAGLIKKSGKIDKAISQAGRKITVDAEQALELYRLSKNK
jgi:hypothetical protein